MVPQEVIIKKRDGGALTDNEIAYFIRGYVDGSIADYQMAALAMAILLNGMEPREIATLVRCMMESGETYDLSEIGKPLVDKHSTGGVGDKVSLILAPLAAACGLAVPMVSGRGLGHTGGTLDKLESIPGFNVRLGFDDFKRLVGELGVCMIGQTDTFVPADKKLYALRDVTGTVESIPLIVGSILSKKFASGARALVMDVKFGSGAFMDTRAKAEQLAGALEAVGVAMKTPISCLLSDMNQPLGAAVGHTHEVLESLDLLRGSGPADLRRLILDLTAEMIVLGKVRGSKKGALELATEKLDDGSALRLFRRLVAAQGGDATVCDGATLGWRGAAAKGEQTLDLARMAAGSMKCAAKTHIVAAARPGKIEAIDTRAVGMAALELGAGRKKTTDPVDHGVGIIVHAKVGDKVAAGAPLYTLYHRDKGVDEAAARLTDATTIG